MKKAEEEGDENGKIVSTQHSAVVHQLTGTQNWFSSSGFFAYL